METIIAITATLIAFKVTFARFLTWTDVFMPAMVYAAIWVVTFALWTALKQSSQKSARNKTNHDRNA